MSEYLQVSELEEFFEREADEVYTYLEIICRDPDVAADLLQNIFVKFIEQVKKGRILQATAPNYLKRMARNEANEKFRQARRETALADEHAIQADEGKVKREEQSREIHRVLLEAISDPELPEDIGTILKLRLLQEADMEIICRELNKSRATVYRRLEKGLQLLAEAFSKEGLTLDDLHH